MFSDSTSGLFVYFLFCRFWEYFWCIRLFRRWRTGSICSRTARGCTRMSRTHREAARIQTHTYHTHTHTNDKSTTTWFYFEINSSEPPRRTKSLPDINLAIPVFATGRKRKAPSPCPRLHPLRTLALSTPPPAPRMWNKFLYIRPF